jgi:hypothetical protein
MDNDLATYIERLELMAFFAGYPLIYAVVHFIAGYQQKKSPAFAKKMLALLPYAYAFIATLFTGLLIKDMAVNYTAKNTALLLPFSYLKIWGCLAVVCWFPRVAKKPVISLCHSLVFFFLLLKDIFLHNVSSPEIIKNDMKIYTDSLLLNTASFLVVLITYLIVSKTIDKSIRSIK